MTESISLLLAGETVEALAGRALYWPRADLLLIADLHLGKGDAFRRGGVAVPSGGTDADLGRLTLLLAATGAKRLTILGDVVHGALPPDARWIDQWRQWRLAHRHIDVAAVAGNHDRALDPGRLDIDLLSGSTREGPFVFRHEPAPDAAGYVLAGHLHPVARLRGPGLSTRLPVFWFGERVGVLPAYSAFTGGAVVEPAPADRLLACADGLMVELPPDRPPSSRRPSNNSRA